MHDIRHEEDNKEENVNKCHPYLFSIKNEIQRAISSGLQVRRKIAVPNKTSFPPPKMLSEDFRRCNFSSGV